MSKRLALTLSQQILTKPQQSLVSNWIMDLLIMLIKRLHAKHIVGSLQLVCEIQVLRRDDCVTFFCTKKKKLLVLEV